MNLSKKMSKCLPIAKIIVLALILSAGISIVYAWVGPTAPFPDGNVDAPLNVGSSAQAKDGPLDVNNSFWADFLGATGAGYINGNFEIGGTLKIPTGSPAFGRVLMAQNAQGDVAWSGISLPYGLSCVHRIASGEDNATAFCSDPSEILTGGGGFCNFGGGSTMIGSRPVSTGNGGWEVTCTSDGSGTNLTTATAVCCKFAYPAPPII